MGKLASVMMVAALLVAGCDDLPKDPDQTLTRVRRDGQFQVAIISAVDAGQAVSIIRRVEQTVGARANLRQGHGEELLHELEQGRIDLVVGEFAENSPWSRKTTFSAPLGGQEPAKDQRAMRAVLRNGENAWIMAVEKAVRGQ